MTQRPYSDALPEPGLNVLFSRYNGSTIGFSVDSAEQGDAFHAAGIANGGTTCEDPPGPRESGAYLAYLRDPDGNKICAIHRPG